MSLIIADNSLLKYALYHAIDKKEDTERSNWICNRISENIQHIDRVTLLHLKQIINVRVPDEWDYLHAAPFKRLRTYIFDQLKEYA